jgi:D-3-phosphoglycerate dehydrogenase
LKILLADKLHPRSIEAMKSLAGVEVFNQPGLSADDLSVQLKGVDVLIVRSTKVNAAAVAAADKLGLIIRAGSGYNTIDVEGASAKGIYVANCPGKNAVAVAELAVGLILAIERQLAENVYELRAKRWDKGRFSKATGLKGKTVGIVGTGTIGQETIARLRPFGVRLVAWSRSLSDEQAEKLGVERCSNLRDLARQSDVVSLHLALTEDTKKLIGEEFLEALQPGAILINTCRAEIVDERALQVALFRGVKFGTDVFHNEPTGKDGVFESEVAQHLNTYGTHHIGASTDQAELETGMEAFRIVEAFQGGQPIPNCVNLRNAPATGYALTVLHQDRVGVLAGVMVVLKEHGHNVQEMSNQIFAGAKAASARLVLEQAVSPDVETALGHCDGVLHVRSSSLAT